MTIWRVLEKLVFGRDADWADVYHDGQYLRIRCDRKIASDLLLICGAARTLELDTGVWLDDNAGGLALGRGSAAPDVISQPGQDRMETIGFDGSNTAERVSWTRELNHNYKEGTDLRPHVHWFPTSTAAGNVKWLLDYEIYGESTLKASGTLSVVSPASGVAGGSVYAALGTITGTTFKIGDQCRFCLYRTPADSSDTYGADAGVDTFGFHYQANTLGSRYEAAK